MYPFKASCSYKRHNDIKVKIDIDAVSTMKDAPCRAWAGVFGNIKVGVIIFNSNDREIINTWLYHRCNAEQVVDDLQELIEKEASLGQRHPELGQDFHQGIRAKYAVCETLKMAIKGISDHTGKDVQILIPEPVHIKYTTVNWETLPPINFDANYNAENDNLPLSEEPESLIQW